MRRRGFDAFRPSSIAAKPDDEFHAAHVGNAQHFTGTPVASGSTAARLAFSELSV
jgi:hypothetical protein